jgi:hypothetical protein
MLKRESRFRRLKLDEHCYQSLGLKMHVNILSTEVVSDVNGNVKAIAIAKVTFNDGGEPIIHKRTVTLRVSPSAPEKRRSHRVAKLALAEITAYFNCDDGENSNIFSDGQKEPEHIGISSSDESELQRELRAIEEEFAITSKSKNAA